MDRFHGQDNSSEKLGPSCMDRALRKACVTLQQLVSLSFPLRCGQPTLCLPPEGEPTDGWW